MSILGIVETDAYIVADIVPPPKAPQNRLKKKKKKSPLDISTMRPHGKKSQLMWVKAYPPACNSRAQYNTG